MTSEIKVAQRSEDMLEKEDPEGPPLDLFEAAVNNLLHNATKRGYVTNAEIKALFSSEEVKSEQIEDILARFSEMDIRVVETDPELEAEELATHVGRRNPQYPQGALLLKFWIANVDVKRECERVLIWHCGAPSFAGGRLLRSSVICAGSLAFRKARTRKM
jgi:Sigma-70 factor, region 1.1